VNAPIRREHRRRHPVVLARRVLDRMLFLEA